MKEVLHGLPRFKDFAPDESAALDRVAEGGVKKDKAMGDEVAKSVQPVKHTIKIEAAK